jgi:hypothetical protein
MLILMDHEEYNLKIFIFVFRNRNKFLILPVLHSNSIVRLCPTFGIYERNSLRIGIGDIRSSFSTTYIRPFNNGPGLIQKTKI